MSFDEREAIDQANRLPFDLAAYGFTRDLKRATHLSDTLEAGMVGVNTMTLGAVDAPFGGIKDSGHGSEHGSEGMEAFLVAKSSIRRDRASDAIDLQSMN